MSGMFGETRATSPHKSVEWYTPKWIFDALKLEFDLDPCSPHDMVSAVPAKNKYTMFDNGLSKPWFGSVWLNPPYGPDVAIWIRRMIAHGNGMSLVFSRTDARWFHDAMSAADYMLFFSGRIDFVPGKENVHKKSRCGAGTVLFAFGNEYLSAIKRLSEKGKIIRLGKEESNFTPFEEEV